MLQHIAHDVWQVVLGYQLLAVAEFGDSLGHSLGLLWSQLQSQLVEVLDDVRLTGILTQCILTMSSETLRHQIVAIKLILIVAIGMYASNLSEDVIAHHRGIRSHGDAAVSFNQSGNIVQTVFLDIGLCLEHILQNHLNTRQWCIAAAFAQTIHGNVKTLGATQYGSQRVAHRQIVVIMGMEVEVRVRITANHLAHVLHTLQWVQDTQSIRKQEALDRQLHQLVHHHEEIVTAVAHTARPVLQIEIYSEILAQSIVDGLLDMIEMLLRRHLELLGAVLVATLRQEVDDVTAAFSNPVHAFVVIHESQYLNGIQLTNGLGITANTSDSILFAFRHTR